MDSNKQLIENFILEFAKVASSERTLILNFSTPKLLNIEETCGIQINNELELSHQKDRKYDLIIGDLPYGLERVRVDTVSNLNVNKNWSYILYGLRSLNPFGRALFFVEHSILSSQIGKKYLADLAEEGYYLSGAFELPEKLLYPQTAFQPILIAFETSSPDKLFIGEITSDFSKLLDSYLSKSGSDNLRVGMMVEHSSFNSFHKFRIEAEIKGLKTQYNDYTKYLLKDISKEIRHTQTEFENKPNTIYIPRIGTSQVASDLSKITLKQRNYFQVVLDENIVKAEFLALFYQSELGKLILKSLTIGSFIPNINKSDIELSSVVVPKMPEQNLLVLTNQKLGEIQETINQLKAELSLNPKNAGVILDKFESIQGPLKQLSEEDLIFSLIRKGENKHIEFKETFSKNVRTGLKDKEIEKSSLKNIVGFLNADGGTLVIGVCDDGTIKGVEDDFFENVDRYKLNFKNALNAKVGSEFYSLIDYDLYKVNGYLVLKIDCKPSSEPCFYNETEFYVRTNPATDKLEGKKQVDYIRERFK